MGCGAAEDWNGFIDSSGLLDRAVGADESWIRAVGADESWIRAVGADSTRFHSFR